MGPCVPHVVVLGSSLAGSSTALALVVELGDAVRVTVVSPEDRWVDASRLVRVPFSSGDPRDLTLPPAPLEAHGVQVVRAAATAIDPLGRTVTLSTGRTYGWDHLVVATGVVDDAQAVPGIGVAGGGHAVTVTTPAEALHAREAWQAFLADPGDHVVVGAVPGARHLGAAYDLLFHVDYDLRRHGLADRVRLTFVTPEPHLGHLGLGERPHGGTLLGSYADRSAVEVRTDTFVDVVEAGRLCVRDGEPVDFSIAMLLPASVGQPAVAEAPGLADARGLVSVNGDLSSSVWAGVHGVGDAAAVGVPWTTGAPDDPFPAETQGREVAANIATRVRGDIRSASASGRASA